MLEPDESSWPYRTVIFVAAWAMQPLVLPVWLFYDRSRSRYDIDWDVHPMPAASLERAQ